MGKKAKKSWIIEDGPEGSLSIKKWKKWAKSLDALPKSAKYAVKKCKAKAKRRIKMIKKVKRENEPPTLAEAKKRLEGFEGIFAGLNEKERKNLMERGKDYPLGL